MNKPVKCRCGGEACHVSAGCWNSEKEEWMPKFWHKVICKNCGTQTKAFYTKTEAIQAWNMAMGERTAKVKLQDICWEDIRRYKEGMCASCGRSVYDHAKYCDECGCRLEWDE